jgi:prepilin-type N-terminal cleavage/methylation domain-containing protein
MLPKNTTTYTGFTLIEFMVAISIFFVISVASYVPYSHFQKKSLLNQWVKEVVQSLYEARNLSINGLDSGSGNLSVGIYFDTSDDANTSLTFLSYPHSFSGSQILTQETADIQIYKQKQLPQWVQVDHISDHEKFLVFFQSISGVGEYFSLSGWSGVKEVFSWDRLDIQLSYKWAETKTLQRNIEYYTDGNIADF